MLRLSAYFARQLNIWYRATVLIVFVSAAPVWGIVEMKGRANIEIDA